MMKTLAYINRGTLRQGLLGSVSITALFVALFASNAAFALALNASPEMKAMSDHLIQKKIYSRVELTTIFAPIEIDKGVLKLFNRQAEGKPWHLYRDIFLRKDRIEAGKAFMVTHQALLSRVDEKYGVPPHIVTALIGVETFYGTRMGSRSVLRSLATLTAAYPRRAKFFGKELRTFLSLLKKEQLVVEDIEGSYAGAIGIPQFMPTSYEAYAVDFNENGKRDLVHEFEDAAGSVANYLTIHGWKRNAPVARWLSQTQTLSAKAKALIAKKAKPKLSVKRLREAGIDVSESDNTKVSLNKLKAVDGTRYFIGFENFYALTRYNPSNKYAMAIVELAAAINAP